MHIPVKVLRSLLNSELGACTAASRALRLRNNEACKVITKNPTNCHAQCANEPRLLAYLSAACFRGARLRGLNRLQQTVIFAGGLH